MTLLVAIPVYQRGDLVRHCFATAAELELPEGSEIVVFDDMSPSLDVPALIAATRLKCTFQRSAERQGADRMVSLSGAISSTAIMTPCCFWTAT